jgi:hypothetical protein
MLPPRTKPFELTMRIAKELGVSSTGLLGWVGQVKVDAGVRPEVSIET